MTGSLSSFLRKYLPNTQAWITIICLSVVLSSQYGVSGLKKKKFSSQLSCTNAFAGGWQCLLVYSRSALPVLPILLHTKFKTIQCNRIKCLFTTSLGQAISEWNQPFLSLWVVVVETMTLGRFGAVNIIHDQAPSSVTHHCFCIICAVKKANTSYYPYAIVLILQTLVKWSWEGPLKRTDFEKLRL